jgi:peptidyl-prolyl cis-trans isomerase D
MFDAVRNNKRIIQVFLALITLPFAFWGVDSYVRDAGGGVDAATVGGSPISQQEFQQALRDQQERLRPILGGANPALLDNPELRHAVIDTLVNQRLIALHAGKARLGVSNAQLVEFITAVPQLQENGKFSKARYEALVAAQGMSKEMFEARLRQDLVMQQAMSVAADTALPARAASERWIAAQLEEREVSEATLRPEQYEAKVKLGADAVKAFYEANRKRFETPEQVKVEYVVLNQDTLAGQVTVAEEEIRKAYETQRDRSKQPETRRASHILITAGKSASEAETKAAQARAADLLAQLKKAPGDFEKLAKQHSQDPGSAAKGGDLEWFGRGMMVKPFEEAAFALKEGHISDVVRSDFGFHIIKLTGVRAERVQAYDEVKAGIAADLKRQAAAKKYAETAESFINTVYEQPDSLKPAVEKYKLALQQSDWIGKDGAAATPFSNPKLLAALFSDDALKNKRNTEAVEVAPNTLAAARVIEHKPATLLPLDVVKPAIEKALVRQEAVKLAAADGAAMLARLQKGEDVALAWGPSRSVSRANAPQLAPDAVRVVFKADKKGNAPAYAGTAVPGGYALYRIGAVKKYAAAGEEPPVAKALRQRYAQLVTEHEIQAWIEALRARYEVKVNKTVVEAKEK